MREILRWGGWAVAAVAVVVMVVGLLPGGSPPLDDAARAQAIAGSLRCPFCQGESIAEAPSQIADDLHAFIVEKVAEGWTDDEIYAFFVARYGERVRLDPPLGGWGAVLWMAPLALGAVGLAAILSRRRAAVRPPGPIPVTGEPERVT